MGVDKNWEQITPKFCVKCGGQLIEGARFCFNCGNGIKPISVAKITNNISNYKEQTAFGSEQTTAGINQSGNLILDNNSSGYYLDLGKKHHFGDGVEVNFNDAFDNYKKAAEMGNKEAVKYLAELGEAYRKEESDYDTAYECFTLAAKYGGDVRTEMRNLYKQAASDDCLNIALDCITYLDNNGENVGKEAYELGKEFIEWEDADSANDAFRIAEKHSVNIEEQERVAVARIFFDNENYEMAKECYQYADSAVYALEIRELGDILLEEEDFDGALDCYDSAAKKGYVDAVETMRERAEELEDDDLLETAYKFYDLAADYGDAEALNRMGEFYEKGGCDFINIDLYKAADYYRRSAEKGNSVGKENYKRLKI